MTCTLHEVYDHITHTHTHTHTLSLSLSHFFLEWEMFQTDIVNKIKTHVFMFNNPLKPKDAYVVRTAPLTSRRCILYIYSTNIPTEYFKHAAHSPFFSPKIPFIL